MRLYIFGMQSRYLSEEDNRAGGNTIIDNINFCWQSISSKLSWIYELSLCWARNPPDQLWQYQGIEYYQTVRWLLRNR